jgi:hypothetical protein
LAYIIYEGIDPRFSASAEMVNSAEFRVILAANPHLQLFEVEDYGVFDAWDKNRCRDTTFRELTLPMSENHSEHVEIRDTKNNKTMWILFDDTTEVEDPSPELIAILKIMDAYSLKTRNKRIFSTPQHYEHDDHVVLSAEYDFATGDYKLEKNQWRIGTPKFGNAGTHYLIFSYDNPLFINSQKMQDFLVQHPYLKVACSAMDYNTGEMLFAETSLPVVAPTQEDVQIVILDERWNYPYPTVMVIHSDIEFNSYISDPSPEFVEILTMMQTEAAETGKLNKQ